jgi:Cu2+-exporting ATPase
VIVAGDCAHCGLPLGRRPVAGDGARFCCYGCLLAQQVTRARGESGAAAAIVIRLGLALFFAMNVMMLSLPAYAPYVYGAAPTVRSSSSCACWRSSSRSRSWPS